MFQQEEKHYNWKGGRYLDKRGYIYIRISSRKYMQEHRYVMEQHLGRPLGRSECVHHINGNKTDNNLSNLELTDWSKHTKHHWETGELQASHIKRGHAKCHSERPHHAKGLCHHCYHSRAAKLYRQRHPEAVKESKKKYAQKNKQKIQAYKRKIRALKTEVPL